MLFDANTTVESGNYCFMETRGVSTREFWKNASNELCVAFPTKVPNMENKQKKEQNFQERL